MSTILKNLEDTVPSITIYLYKMLQVTTIQTNFEETHNIVFNVLNVFNIQKNKKMSAWGWGQAGSNTNRACPQHWSGPAYSMSHC